MSTLLPQDDNGHPIQLLSFAFRGTQTVAVIGASARNAAPLPTGVEVVTIFATVPCFFEVGDINVTASATGSPFLAPGQYVDLPLPAAHRFVAFIAAGDTGAAYVMGRV